MAEHTDPGNKTDDQIEDEAWDCFRLRAEGFLIKEIAFQTQLSRETVKRRLSMILSHDRPPRDLLKALAEQRLDIATRAITNELGREDRDQAKLATALVAVERRRAALWGLDEPTQKRVEVGNIDRNDEPPTPEMATWLAEAEEKFLNSDLHRDNLEATGQ